MNISPLTLWTVIILLGIGTFLLRFSFLGMIGGRRMPEWLLRHLRYTPVAVLPGLVAPAVLWPAGTGGETDPVRLAAAAATLIGGWYAKSLIGGVAAGAVTLYGLGWLIG